MQFKRTITALALVLLLAVGCALLVHAEKDGSGTGSAGASALVARQAPRAKAPPLLVTLLDGNMAAVDPDSGRLLWTFKSGVPLLSAKQSEDSDVHVFPGADGGLYAYAGGQDFTPGLERLPLSLPELVAASPSMTDSGSMLLGKQDSTVYVLDRRTGQLLHTIVQQGGSMDGSFLEDALASDDAADHLLFIARQDFTVRSVQLPGGMETWNATFGRMLPLLPRGGGIIGGAVDGGRLDVDLELDRLLRDQMHGSAAPRHGLPLTSALGLPKLAVGADNTLQAYDPATGYRKWVRQFSTPPIGAYRGDGTGSSAINVLALRPEGAEASTPLGPSTAAASALARHPASSSVPPTKLKGRIPGGATVLVGALHGSLYALPADHLIIEPGTQPDDWRALPSSSISGRSGAADSQALALAVLDDARGASGGSSGSSGNSGDEQLVPLTSNGGGLSHVVNGLTCPLGLHAVNMSNLSLPWLPEAAVARGVAPGFLLEAPLDGPAVAPARGLWARLDPGMLVLLALVVLMVGLRLARLFWRRRTLNGARLHQATASKGKGKPSKSKAKAKAKLQEPLPTAAEAPLERWNGRAAADTTASEELQRAVMHSNGFAPLQDAGSVPTVAAQAATPAERSATAAVGSESTEAAAATVAVVAVAGAKQPSAVRVNADGSVQLGRLQVGPGVLGYGSAGTVVYDGMLDGRPVAVKRLLRQFHDIARKELNILIVSDEHPNIVRCFAMEEDREFVYVALERCKATLADHLSRKTGTRAFVDASGCPTPACMRIMHDIAQGLCSLHERGIVHRDLKPHNVLLTESGRAKLSDMGLSKQLGLEQSSFESHGSGGSSGWQAPEQLVVHHDGRAARQSKSTDIFSLGCLLYYCATGGRHPFGQAFERDANILRGAPDLVPLQRQPEALNLIAAMLAKDAKERPPMEAVLAHPLWWSPEHRLQLLVDVSDRVENEDREPDQTLLAALESCSYAALGANWGAAVESELIANLGRYRRYDYTGLRDLLRVIRNKRNHFREMPESLQQSMGPLPEGYLRYYTSRFPNLLLSVQFFALKYLRTDPNLRKYYPGNPAMYDAFVKTYLQRNGSKLTVPPKRPASVPPAVAAAAGRSNRGTDGVVVGNGRSNGGAAEVAGSGAAPAASASDDAAVSTGRAPEADAAAAQPQSATAVPAGEASVSNADGGGDVELPNGSSSDPPGPIIVGYEPDEDQSLLVLEYFPRRPGKQVCDYYVKTGHCKYSDSCIFDHPEEHAVHRNPQGLPYRPDQPLCGFFIKTNQCKFGPSCKFSHPKLRPIYAGSQAPV